VTTTWSVPAWASPDTNLTGSTMLVVGGAGGVGEGVTRALLAAGATVVATARSAAKLEGLWACLGYPNNLVVRTLDLLDPGLASTVAGLVEQYGPLHGAVISVAD
jgi:NADP-dependent 3-hydroxy acid dehydrogenase YdfG